MFAEDEWLSRIRALDERLRPIATRPIDISDPGCADKLQSSSPLDEAGVRSSAEGLLQSLIQAYASGDNAARAAIRSLLRRFSSFAWAATLAVPMTTTAGVRAHLLHFSILDQSLDPRDAPLWLDDLVQSARNAGLDVEPLLSEVASLSSRENRHSWGSTADWLLRRAGAGYQGVAADGLVSRLRLPPVPAAERRYGGRLERAVEKPPSHELGTA